MDKKKKIKHEKSEQIGEGREGVESSIAAGKRQWKQAQRNEVASNA